LIRRILYTLLGCLLFGAVIAMHEAGHLVAGLLFGLNVVEFSIGFGPLLGQVHAWGLDWSFRAIPLGGYCALEVENISTWPMFFTLSAGLAVNFLAAYGSKKSADWRGEGESSFKTPDWMENLPWYYGGSIVRLFGFPFVVMHKLGVEIEEGDFFRAHGEFHLLLGICNLIPIIPILDGGKMLGILLSKILRGGEDMATLLMLLSPIIFFGGRWVALKSLGDLASAWDWWQKRKTGWQRHPELYLGFISSGLGMKLEEELEGAENFEWSHTVEGDKWEIKVTNESRSLVFSGPMDKIPDPHYLEKLLLKSMQVLTMDPNLTSGEATPPVPPQTGSP